MFEIRPESSHFERVLEESLLDGCTDFFSAFQEKFGYCLRGTFENCGPILHPEQMTKPSVK